MIKGLQKDHRVLLDLVISHLNIINKNLLELFDSLIEAFQDDSNSRILECIHLRSKFSNMSITQKYLKTLNMKNILVILEDLEYEVLPCHSLVLKVLGTINQDHIKRTALLSSNRVSTITSNILLASSPKLIKRLFKQIKSLIENFKTLLSKSQFQTKFSPSLYSFDDIVIIGFDSYEEEYESLLDNLFDFKQDLNDWGENIRKSSPSFLEYSSAEYGAESLRDENFGVFMDSFEMDSFEKFSQRRKEDLHIPYRCTFGN